MAENIKIIVTIGNKLDTESYARLPIHIGEDYDREDTINQITDFLDEYIEDLNNQE